MRRTLTATSRNTDPSKVEKVVTHLSPSFFSMQKDDYRRFGTLTGKVESLAEGLIKGPLDTYTLS